MAAAEITPAAAAEAYAKSKVIDDDNLLNEILIRISFPTTLVRAAAVCKRWLHLASGRKFLRRFRELHPPRLLGFYHNSPTSPRFVPMLPQPPELAAVIRRSSFSLDDSQSDDAWTYIMDCRGNSVFTRRRDRSGLTLAVHNVLRPGRDMVVVPPFPRDKPQDGYLFTYSAVLSKEEGDGLSYFNLFLESSSANILVHVYALQAGVWRAHTSASTQNRYLVSNLTALLVHNKIYIVGITRVVLVLDLTASSLSTVRLPPGVEYDSRYTVFSRAGDNSGVYLVHSNDRHELGIWLHNGDNWLLVDTIDLPAIYTYLVMSDDTLDTCVNVCILHVADNAEFMFLEMGQWVLHLDVKSRTLRKVYEMEDERYLGRVYPFMMIWPPTFPALKDDDPARISLNLQFCGVAAT
ncbi:hypothetical protein QYE76_035751 [Lolium multiflorum]|uniref:F-box protein AT5G49610-like beta-propeller domain-containing protein n=1 Tax=Lolium multiflorum TaxID=4521 RepID=A0AAD8VPI3_LOLMU|nr:hypothetical protein QYE76_035751 [Lolium multiflorum]